MKLVRTGRGIHSPEFYQKKVRRRKLWFWGTLVAILFLASLLVYVSRLESLLVREVEISGVEAISTLEVRNFIKEEIAGHYLWLIPKSNIFLLPRDNLRESLLREFLWFKSLEFRWPSDGILFVEVEERSPHSLYCEDFSDESLASCYFLDETSLIFARSPGFLGVVYSIYTTREPLVEPLGQTLFLEEEFRSFPAFFDSLSVLGLEPLALEVGTNDYKLLLKPGSYVVWKKNRPLSSVRLDLETFLFSAPIREQEDFLDRVLYLDLLTEDKVFYKFKGQ